MKMNNNIWNAFYRKSNQKYLRERMHLNRLVLKKQIYNLIYNNRQILPTSD